MSTPPPKQLSLDAEEAKLNAELDKIKTPRPMSPRGGISIALWYVEKIGNPAKAKIFLESAIDLLENLKNNDENKTR